jgi:Protein of unknown function (DUF3037)
MATQNPLRECAYFLVQYVPDLVRGEFVNIGLFLHSPQEQYLGCLFTDDYRRIKRFHPQADLELLRELQLDFEQQIDEHGGDLEGYLHAIENSLSNLIQLAPPRTCLLNDPPNEIRDLFARYVGGRAEAAEPEDTRLRVKQRLTSALAGAGVWEKLEKRIAAARWTHPGDAFSFDYGYRAAQVAGKPNGHLRLIHALSLRRDSDLAKVLVYTLDHVRRKEPAELTAVVEGLAAQGDEPAALCQHILEEGKIAIQPLAGVQEFAQSVRRELLT